MATGGNSERLLELIGRLDGKLDALGDKMDELTIGLSRVEQDVQVLNQNQENTSFEVKNLATKLDGLDQKVNGLDEKVEGLGQKVDGLGRKVDGLDEKVDVLGRKVDKLNQGTLSVDLSVESCLGEIRGWVQAISSLQDKFRKIAVETIRNELRNMPIEEIYSRALTSARGLFDGVFDIRVRQLIAADEEFGDIKSMLLSSEVSCSR